MPSVQLSPDREAAAHLMAQARTALAVAHARAAKIAHREPHLITTFALHAEIEVIESRADELCQLHDFTAANTLRATATRLRALCPEN